MKQYAAVVLAALWLSSASYAQACKQKRKAMHESRETLKECNMAWQKSLRPNSPDPTDDCAAKQAAFVAAVKEVKACQKEAKEKK